MTREERKNYTYIGSAEIKLSNTTRRDALVEAAKKAGFIVECNEAFDLSFSGASSDSYWAIRVSAPGRLVPAETKEAREKLAAAWKGL